MPTGSKLPPEFYSVAEDSGRRSYRLAHYPPDEDPVLKRILEQNFSAASRKPFLIELVGETETGEGSFLESLVRMAREKGFTLIPLHNPGRFVEPLSHLKEMVGVFTDGGDFNLLEEMSPPSTGRNLRSTREACADVGWIIPSNSLRGS